jgi:hypothetical protein
MASTEQDVRIILLPEKLYEYLLFVFQAHCGKGLDTDELLAGSELWNRIKNAPKIDFSQLGKVKMDTLNPQNVAISIEPDPGEPSRVPDIVPI